MLRRQASAPLALAIACTTIGSLDAGGAQAPRPAAKQVVGADAGAAVFGPIAGVREFSGRVIARPRQAQDRRQRGLNAAQAMARRAEAIARVNPSLIRSIPEVDELLLNVPLGMTDAEYASQLFATGDYEYVEPDWRVFAVTIPNDPQYPQQWHLPKISAPAAWNLTTGSADVIIAICDSGIDLDHPDLAAALVSGYNAVDQLPQSSGGQVDGLTNHGTQVAGCAGAIGNNATGVCGVGWNLRLMPIRVSNLPNDSASISDINGGARWAVDHGAKVINASFSNVQTASVQTTGEYIRNAGGNYVWAAGNAAASLGAVDHPDVMIVGATDQNDARASFSNFGRGIDVVAPGVSIRTTSLNGYAPNSGTSFASPITAGVLGLVWSVNPSLTPAAAETIVEVTAADLGAPGEDDEFGAGRINAAAAVQLALDAGTTALPPIARNDSAAVLSTEAITIEVLRNDVDLNGDAIDIASFDATTPAGGAVSLVTTGDPALPHALSYLPASDFEGIDTFAYTASDSTALTDSATVQVGVVHAIAFAPPATITFAGFATPTSIEQFDLDGDGDLDLIGNYLDTLATLKFLRNDGDGNFALAGGVALSAFSTLAVGFGEFTSDECVDIVFVEQLANRLGVSAGDCDMHFSAPIVSTLNGANCIVTTTADGQPLDFNADGKQDIAVGQAGFPTFIRIMLGDGAGHFTSVGSVQTIDQPAKIAAGDMTGDGVPEIVMVGGGLGDVVVARIGTAGQILSSQTFNSGALAADLALFDLEEDGDLDVATVVTGVLGTIPGVRILRNNGSGVLAAAETVNATGEFPQGLAAGDFDADGDGDFATANLNGNSVSVFPGLASGALLGVSSLLTADVGVHDLAAGDFEGDGDLDLAAILESSGSQRVMVFRNLTDPPQFGVGDLNHDGAVNIDDLLMVIGGWGPCPTPPAACAADADANGVVNIDDLLLVISHWG